MLPLVQREVVEKNYWLMQDDLLSIVSIVESIPGGYRHQRN